MKKAVYVVISLLFASWCLQCSNSPYDGYESADSYPKIEQNPILYENGQLGNYSTVYNARMIVDSIDYFLGDSISSGWLKDAFLGIDVPGQFEKTSATTEVYLDSLSNDFYIYVHQPDDNFGVLGHSDPDNGYGNGTWFEMTYSIVGDKISIEGKGGGLYLGCEVPEGSWGAQGALYFQFQGTYNVSFNGYEGGFEWQQVSEDRACNFSCGGTMTILLD